MRKTILFAAFIAFFAIPVLAQQQGPPPPPAPDYSPKIWKEYSYPGDNVRFKFPVEPVVGSDDALPSVESVHVYDRTSFMKFELTVKTGAADKDTEAAAAARLNAAHDQALKGLASLDPTIIKDEDTTVDGHPAKFLHVETSGGLVIRTKFISFKNRLYVATAIVRKGPPHGFNWENDFEVPAMAFLDSIHFINNN